MLNVSQMSCSPNGDNNYQNITILSRPLTSSGHNGTNANTNTRRQQTESSISSKVSDQPMSAVVSPSAPLSLTSIPSGSQQQPNESQSLRSTVVANNCNTNDTKQTIGHITGQTTGQTSGQTSGQLVGDKSPMCRINEISRFNDIKHTYHLIDESGPPHNKSFTVVLKLGEIEEFRGTGPSIKKAQRNAATLALEQTKLKQPTPRLQRHNKGVWPMTPTVELNVLAMRLGQTAVYQVYEPPRPQTPAFSLGPLGANGSAANAYDFRGMHYQRYRVPRGPFSASLMVGCRQFMGKGNTAQAARHAAAEEALKALRHMITETNESTVSVANQSANETINSVDTTDTNDSNCENTVKSPISLVHEMALKRNWSVNFEVIDESGPSHMPKFVTKCTVAQFTTTGEGNGKKISKKNAALLMVEELKKLEPLVVNNKTDTKSDGIPIEQSCPLKTASLHNNSRKKNFNRKKSNNFNKNIIKDNSKHLENRTLNIERKDKNDNKTVGDIMISNDLKSDSNEFNINDNKNNSNQLNDNSIDQKESHNLVEDMSEDAPIHPINRLIQLQQARKEKEPNFTLISERVIDRRRREFTIECTIQLTKGSNGCQTVSAIGLGPNKKVAKKNSADQMLQLLGYSSRGGQPQSILKQDSMERNDGQSCLHKKIRQVKFIEDDTTHNTSILNINCGSTYLPKMGRQLVPGLILMPKEISSDINLKKNTDPINCGLNQSPDMESKKTSEIDSKSMNGCKSATNESISAKIKSISSIAKEFLDSKLAICHKKAINPETSLQSCSVYSSNRSEQLKSLIENVGSHQLQVHFSDFPKKLNSGQSIEYLSVVTITTVWNQRPIVSHGSGPTVEEARNQASQQALVHLAQLEDSN